MSIKIFVMTHKQFEAPTDSMYVPLQVGHAISPELGYLADDTGDNISRKNKSFCELTGIYWLWNAITLYLRCNPVFAAKDPRRAQLDYAAASAGLGIAWIIISFFTLSNEALPMLLVSLPFVVWMGWPRAKQK